MTPRLEGTNYRFKKKRGMILDTLDTIILDTGTPLLKLSKLSTYKIYLKAIPQ